MDAPDKHELLRLSASKVSRLKFCLLKTINYSNTFELMTI